MAPSLTLALHLLVVQGVSQAIQITRLEVPRTLAEGDSGELECQWEDEGDHVYSLKWYQGIDEFYRWTPLETPEVKTFPSRHFSVDTRTSQRGRVLIHNVTLAAGGNYRCEVSGEAPTFKTSFSTGHLTVVDLPDGVPKISSSTREPYRLQQLVTLTCLSHGGRPAPSLTFYLNNQLAERQWGGSEEVVVNASTGQETAVKHLKFLLRPSLAPEGLLQVKCVASYPDLYWESSEKYFTVELPDALHRPPGSQEFVYNGSEDRSVSSSLLISTLVVVVGTIWLR